MLATVFWTFPFQGSYDFAFSPGGDTAANSGWVDSVMKTMTPDERIGQLLMLELSGKWKPGDALYDKLEKEVDICHVGGVIFFYGGPAREAALINRLQSRVRIPLMVAQDGEWGLSMRLDSVPAYPRNLCLGAVADDGIVYELGREIGRECRRLGVNIDFMPCVDIYDNPANTVIANRSFGSGPLNVARKGCAMMLGMKDEGIVTTAKHFPGHGNTAVDSHEALPVINDSRERLDTFDLYPFKYLIKNGVPGVMVGHLFVPALESNSTKVPSSISKNVIDGLLKTELGYGGLVFTDALKMKGVSGSMEGGEVAVRAFEAGVDVLLMPPDGQKAYNALVAARNAGRISQADIDSRCRKILQAKVAMGLHEYKPVALENIYDDLNTSYAASLSRRIYENAVTLVSNKDTLLPLRGMDGKRIAVVSIGKDAGYTEFESVIERYAQVTKFSLSKSAAASAFTNLAAQLAGFDVVLVAFHDGSSYPSSFGATAAMVSFIDNLAAKERVVLSVFTSPLALTKFKNLDKCSSIVVSYDDSPASREATAHIVMGGKPFLGHLPVDAGVFKEGTGIHTKAITIE